MRNKSKEKTITYQAPDNIISIHNEGGQIKTSLYSYKPRTIIRSKNSGTNYYDRLAKESGNLMSDQFSEDDGNLANISKKLDSFGLWMV